MRGPTRLVRDVTVEADRYVIRWTLFSAPITVIDGKLFQRALSSEEMRKIDEFEAKTQGDLHARR